MKFFAPIAVMFVMFPLSFASAAEAVDRQSLFAQLEVIEVKLHHLQMRLRAQVLGASTSRYFTVSSDDKVIAESYVPVTRSLADSWCTEMSTNEAFEDTQIECVHGGTIIN
jgi:hypothetical protein